MVFGVKAWGLDGEWREVDKIHGRCLQKILEMIRLAARVGGTGIRK
jgi:hypothetical protein